MLAPSECVTKCSELPVQHISMHSPYHRMIRSDKRVVREHGSKNECAAAELRQITAGCTFVRSAKYANPGGPDHDRDDAMWRVQVPTNWRVPAVVEPWPRRRPLAELCVHVLLLGAPAAAGLGHAFAGTRIRCTYIHRRGAGRTCVRAWRTS